jgi:small subunit ribosomal protein S20
MANTRSAEKNIRKTKVRTLRNQAGKSRVRTFRKRVISAIEKGDLKLAEQELSLFSSVADKAGKVSLLHKNTVNRLKSRMALRLKKAAAAPAAN